MWEASDEVMLQVVSGLVLDYRQRLYCKEGKRESAARLTDEL